MAERRNTIFKNLSSALFGTSISPEIQKLPPTMDVVPTNRVLYSTNNKEDYERKLQQYKQQKLLSYQWAKAGVDNAMESLAGYTAVKLMYRDADLMDEMPEIGSALDIISEEACLEANTKIKLLNGKTFTIEELYENNLKDFWVYTVDENGICKPSKVDHVVYKGEKPLYEIRLDDGTIINCTEDHKWLLSNLSWVETKDLIKGNSLMTINTSMNYLGYEQIKSTVESKKRLTHQIVAESELYEEKLKLSAINKPFQKIVIHHNTFDKLNNEPSSLTYMFWDDHQKLHTDLNSKRWDNADYNEKMSKIFSETAKKTWEEQRETLIEKLKESHKNFKKSESFMRP